MVTIRTDQKYEDYFLKNWDKVAVENNKHLYLGHYHLDKEFPNLTLVPSSGYNGKNRDIQHREGNISIDADIHLGISETKGNVSTMIERWKSNDYGTIIMLGDVLEMQELTDDQLDTEMHKSGFYEFIEGYKGNLIYVIGNHDINIKSSILKDIILEHNENVKFVEYYRIDCMMFAHGHQYDTHIQKWGVFYYWIFKVGDYLNLPKNIIKKLIAKFK